MSSDPRDTTLPVVASLEHLTGPSRGRVTWLDGSALDLCLNAQRRARVEHADPEGLCEGHVGRFHRVEDSYQIEAPEDVPVWVFCTKTGDMYWQAQVSVVHDLSPSI